MLQRIDYIANKDAKVISRLKKYLQNQGYDSVKYNIDKAPPAEFLLIVEPFGIDSELYAISTTWKPWLMEFRPNTRLIVAAYAQSRHPNCIDLLDLPGDMKGWLAKTRPVSDFPLIETKKDTKDEKMKYVDPWMFDLVKTGNDLNLQMRKFIFGHEESKSLFAQITSMRKALLDLKYYSSKNAAPGNQDAAQAKAILENLWDYFYHRWSYYSKVFDFVPYQGAIVKIRKNVKKIYTIMDNATSTDQYPEVVLLDEMIQTIKKEMMPYIFPEEYW